VELAIVITCLILLAAMVGALFVAARFLRAGHPLQRGG
jgi:hypothetical protein